MWIMWSDYVTILLCILIFFFMQNEQQPKWARHDDCVWAPSKPTLPAAHFPQEGFHKKAKAYSWLFVCWASTAACQTGAAAAPARAWYVRMAQNSWWMVKLRACKAFLVFTDIPTEEVRHPCHALNLDFSKSRLSTSTLSHPECGKKIRVWSRPDVWGSLVKTI